MKIKNISVFKTMRHIETVRNYLNAVVKELLKRGEEHDQSKLQKPEVEIFDEYTPKLRNCEYGSDEYKGYLKEMQKALDSHYSQNRHHPQFFSLTVADDYQYHNGKKTLCSCMNLIDLIEMFCDWYAATKRHNTGDIYKSIELNQKRDGYSDELKEIFKETAKFLEDEKVVHFANES